MLLKRFFDFSFALLLLLALSPIMVVVALLVWVSMGRPILFCQRRPGLNEKIFTIYKFRTMKESYDKKGSPLADGLRLTPVGSTIRKLSLDELPQLLNVLRGEMSFVGPRPLLPEYLERYNNQQKKRHNRKPGITGLAQVEGRNEISWDERLRLDVWYVENWSLWLDIKILWRTVGKVLRRSGIAQSGNATMTPFLGSEKETQNHE